MENSKERPKAYGYLRVSSKAQAEEGNGLTGQKTSIKLEADRRGIDVVEFYEDGGISGKYDSRIGLDKMIDDLKKVNKKGIVIKYIMVDDIDRAARDIDVWRFVKTAIKSTGASIYSLKQELKDTPENQMFETIVMSVKQYERENGARRVKDRQRCRMIDGFWVFNLPLGYKYVEAPDKHGKIVVPDPDSFPIIKEGLNLLAKGTIANKAQLHRFFQQSGMRSKGGNKIYKSFVDHMLRKENLIFYASFINYEPRSLHMIKAKHEAAIDEGTFYSLVNKFKIKGFYKDFPENYINERLPLRQILKCSHCGAGMSGTPSKGTGGTYFYYFCDNSACSHRRKSINEKYIHEAIESFLDKLSMDDSYSKAFELVMNYFWNHKQDVKQSLRGQKLIDLEDMQKKIDDLVKKCMTATSPTLIASYEKEIISLEENKKILEAELLSGSEKVQEEDFIHHFSRLKAIVQAPIGIWNIGNIELKRMLISTLFDGTLTYSKDHGIQTTKMPTIYKVFCSTNESIIPYNMKGLYESFLKNEKDSQTIGESLTKRILAHNFLMVGDIGLEPMTPCL